MMFSQIIFNNTNVPTTSSNILSKVILAAKHTHFNRIIRNSENEIKSTWKIINEEKGKSKYRPHTQFLKTNNNIISNQEVMANTFNNYFLSVAELLNNENKGYDKNTTPIHYLQNYHTKPRNKMKWKYVSTYKLEKTIKSLNPKILMGMTE
jgi:uncharacterized protein YktB (UPF0637 family)